MGLATRDKQSVSGARTLRAGTQSVQAHSGKARSNTVREGRNSLRRYSGYTAISVPAVTVCVLWGCVPRVCGGAAVLAAVCRCAVPCSPSVGSLLNRYSRIPVAQLHEY